MSFNRRRRYLIDSPVQLGLLRRLALYSGYCIVTALLLVFFGRLLMAEPARAPEHLLHAITEAAPLLLALFVILPFVVFDLLKLTNRFAGPAYRVRVTLEQLARGETIRPVRFRDSDFWSDLASKLNVLAARLGQLDQTGGDRGVEKEAQQVRV
jgi:hypothetical protein